MKQFAVTFTAVLAAIILGYIIITAFQKHTAEEAVRQASIAKLEDTINRLEKDAKDWDEMRLERKVSKIELIEHLTASADILRGIANGKVAPQNVRDTANLAVAKIEVIIRDAQ